MLICLEVSMKGNYILMTLLESLPPSYEHLIIVLETMSMKELTIEYVMAHLMLEMGKAILRAVSGER